MGGGVVGLGLPYRLGESAIAERWRGPVIGAQHRRSGIVAGPIRAKTVLRVTDQRPTSCNTTGHASAPDQPSGSTPAPPRETPPEPKPRRSGLFGRQPRPAGRAYPRLPQVLYKEPRRSFPGLQRPAALADGGSSNGRTGDSASGTLGSHPSPPATSKSSETAQFKRVWPPVQDSERGASACNKHRGFSRASKKCPQVRAT